MSRSESRPPAGLKIVDAHLQLGPVRDAHLGKIGDHQTGAMGSDEFGAFLGRFQLLHHLGGAQCGHFQRQRGHGAAGHGERLQQLHLVGISGFSASSTCSRKYDAGRVDISCTYWAMLT